MTSILNVAGGKMRPIDLAGPYFLVNVDKMYYRNADPDLIEQEYVLWRRLGSKSFNVRLDVFEFMERTALWFDKVCVYRYLEHVSMDKVLYFIYLLSTVTKKGATIDVIVPNYELLAKMILDEKVDVARKSINFESSNIILTTELLNEPSCPHASIWTTWRAHHFFQLEKRFIVREYSPRYEFDGRNIYLRFIAERL